MAKVITNITLKDGTNETTFINDVKIFDKERPEVLTYTYPADHGFNCDHRSQYNKDCARIALDRTLKFLEENLT